MNIVYFNKKYAETLAQMRDRFRKNNPQYLKSKITYAGRLDPMAQGLMCILTDEDIHKKSELIGLNKVYEVEFIFGIKSDTYDILGVIDYKKDFRDDFIDEKLVKAELIKLFLEKEQLFPPYSSRKVNGKPMWLLTRSGIEEKIMREINISNIEYLGFNDINKDSLKESYLEKINKVEGDFRQGIIIKNWSEYLRNINREVFRVYKARFSVSSGTYIRSLINLLGERLKIGGISLKIKRVQLGNRKLKI